ncbi:AAA family ATPase [Nocardia sp. NPDC004722]
MTQVHNDATIGAPTTSARGRGGYDAYLAQPDPTPGRAGRETATGREPFGPPATGYPSEPAPSAPVAASPPVAAIEVAPPEPSGASPGPAIVPTAPQRVGAAPAVAPGPASALGSVNPPQTPIPAAALAVPALTPPMGVRHAPTPAAVMHERPAPAPVEVFALSLTSADLLAEIAAARQARLRSTTGMRGALNKVGFNLGLSPNEQRTESRRARIRRQLNATYQIAVVNVKGGSGRTTTVAALGSTFASLRPDRVVAVDANPDFGDLASRTSRHPYGLTLRDLAQAPNLDAFSAVQSFTSITTSDLAVVASPWSAAAVEALSGPEYLAGVEVLRRHYNLMLIDCGTGVLDSATDSVLRTSDAVVVVTPATVRGVTGAVATLEWLDSHGMQRLAANSVIAIVHQHPAKPIVEVHRIEELFAAAQRPTFLLPYDEHLAEGGEIDLRLLDRETGLAFEELAATLADGFPAEFAGGYHRVGRGGSA